MNILYFFIYTTFSTKSNFILKKNFLKIKNQSLNDKINLFKKFNFYFSLLLIILTIINNLCAPLQIEEFVDKEGEKKIKIISESSFLGIICASISFFLQLIVNYKDYQEINLFLLFFNIIFNFIIGILILFGLWKNNFFFCLTGCCSYNISGIVIDFCYLILFIIYIIYFFFIKNLKKTNKFINETFV